MKKIFVFLALILFISGCGKNSDKNLVKELSKKVSDSNSYHLTATLEIYRNEEKYSYDVDSSYMKGDYYKVNLVNKNNNHEQVILKNKDGVYVLTPALNKSFKFQSDWPYNNSQIYLLQPIMNDITNDSNRTLDKTEDGYILTSKVNYSTEKDFKKQKLYIDKDKNLTKVEIVDEKDSVKMCLTVIDIEYNSKFDEEYFSATKYLKDIDNNKQNEEVKENQNSNSKNDTKQSQETAKLDEIVYPMYVPTDTYLSAQDVVSTQDGERVILTFTGESAFTVVQETAKNDELATNYVYGDPYLILDTVGAITDYSVTWLSNGVEYSVMSDTMSVDELLTVAQSISVKAVGK